MTLNTPNFFFRLNPYFVFWIAMLLLHIPMYHHGDDLFFLQAAHEGDWFGFLQMRYTNWSSRVVIELVTLIFMRLPLIVWKGLNSAALVLVAYSLKKLVFGRCERDKDWWSVMVVSLYPLFHMSTAGWVTTSINFLWPVACALYVCTVLGKPVERRSVRKPIIFVYVFMLLFSANNEQVAAVLVMVSGYVLLRSLLFERQLDFLSMIFFSVAFASIVFIMTTPGVDKRFEYEIIRWFPNFEMLSFWDKLALGFSTSLIHYLTLPNLSVIALIISMVLLVKYHASSKLIYYDFVIVVAAANSYGLVNAFHQLKLPREDKLFMVLDRFYGVKSIAGIPDFDRIHLYLSAAVFTSVTVLIGYRLYVLLKRIDNNSSDSVLCTAVLCLGFAPRVIMGFSPTVYASGFRTFIIPYIALSFVTLIVLRKWEKAGNIENKNSFLYRLGACSAAAYFFNLSTVLFVSYYKG
ncbi:MAG: hypothetical protein ACLFVQ_03985 [Chitinispirillaceae bacterium]